MNFINLKLTSIVLTLVIIDNINCASVDVANDGPGVLDIPMTFTARMVGDVPIDINQFVYVFEDMLYPRHREEIISGRTANLTIDYNSKEYSTGEYKMKVQVYAYIWGFKGWLVAEANDHFVLQNGLAMSINITQSGVSPKALSEYIIATNRTMTATTIINDGSRFLKNATASYRWTVDGKTFSWSPSPQFSYNFTRNTTYDVIVLAMVNISKPNSNITKFGQITRQITAKNAIKVFNVSGNTWLLHGALLQLDVNCTGGTPPFWYCWDVYSYKKVNYSCAGRALHFIKECSFPITHYFSKNGTYYIEIGLQNDVDFQNRTIIITVYDKVRQTQLSFVIIPIVSSILAIIIIVVGIACHLQQRQRYNITLEVADFDFQPNEDLIEKTFFERLSESFAKSLRGTLLHPCSRAQNYDDLNDHSVNDQRIANSTHTNNANHLSYEVIK